VCVCVCAVCVCVAIKTILLLVLVLVLVYIDCVVCVFKIHVYCLKSYCIIDACMYVCIYDSIYMYASSV